MKLIIIGNGFDLNHNFKTSFNHFRSYLNKSENLDNKTLIKNIDELINYKENDIQWNQFEEIIGHRMDPTFRFDDKRKNSDIAVLIEQFTEKFHLYITDLVKNSNDKINENLVKEFKDVSTILTFNYTPFYLKYLNNDFNSVFHIHGELEENNLPLIGYYYSNPLDNPHSLDYSVRYGKRLIHKSALALKQNEIDLDSVIRSYNSKWKGKISEIVIMGFSFGKSDDHIYNILDEVMISQTKEVNIPSSKAKNIRIIKFKIYSYNDKESNLLVEKIKGKFSSMNRRVTTNITGVGFSHLKKELITFELKNY